MRIIIYNSSVLLKAKNRRGWEADEEPKVDKELKVDKEPRLDKQPRLDKDWREVKNGLYIRLLTKPLLS